MTDRALLQQALEALIADDSKLWPRHKRTEAITALRERLAQPEQEPMSEMLLIDEATVELALEALENVTKDYVENRQRTHNRAIEKLSKVFVQKPQRTWVGLTDEELAEFSEAKLGAYDMCLEVEAKLREKNNG